MVKLFNLAVNNEKEILEIIKNREEDLDVINDVKLILEEVKKDKDKALIKFNKLFDKVDITNLKVSKEEIDEAFKLVEEDFIEAIKGSIENVKKYHEKQVKNGYSIIEKNGVFMGQLVTPLQRVGVYVPGGTASYPSSVVMNVIPAEIAGVSEIVMVTPPKNDGSINPYILVAASLAGVSEIYKVGGAQSIGALAYGTETIKNVDKIVGPGNIYVAMAKKLVFGTVDIDMVAGPSEILVIADENSNSKYIAADLMSQAEHDKRAASILLTTSEKLYNEVLEEINIQIKDLERKDIIEESLKNYGMAVICEDINKCIELSNKIAPEHLELMIENPLEYLGSVKNAGSIFLGYYSPEPLGDYYAGPNHVLPTNGTARFSSPLSVDSFIKKSSYLYYSKEELQKVSKNIMILAEKEGLTAHRNSVKVRIDND
ncbi:histidinol dehydrogenase [Clostridium sartagoforme AAU1]|uniref:Histidinol dehydrogenase n=1 Tax=Clostridium sartagoforme AAU1 TaxID=1202534 RepID=R9CE66_9CLOT|nr:histidinol dehydrogenase [Clostridium sartagoforme]EOR27568.1 histidinol dehydrogenase [Clostridium sartagoforme AAU1]